MEKFPGKQLIEAKEFKPIIASIIDSGNIDEKTRETFLRIEKDGQFINYYGDKEFYNKNNIKNAGQKTYAISECNDSPKYSTKYYDCTGIIIVGEEKEGSKQISFMSHQDPQAILDTDNKKEEFNKDIIDSINEIKNKTKEKSIDVIIFGGSYGRNYKKLINELRDIIIKEMGIEPVVMTGPNCRVYDYNDDTRVYFDTQNRRLFIARPDQYSEVNESYFASEIEEKMRKW